MKKTKFTVVILLSSLIISCGFHLRGSQDLSAILPEVRIQGVNKHSELGRALDFALTNAKISIYDKSKTLLNIRKNIFAKRVLSLDNSDRANQYELSFNLSFALVELVSTTTQSNEVREKLVDLINMQTISVKREYLFNADLVLASEEEEARLKTDMINATMRQLVQRLSFLLKAKKNLKTKSDAK